MNKEWSAKRHRLSELRALEASDGLEDFRPDGWCFPGASTRWGGPYESKWTCHNCGCEMPKPKVRWRQHMGRTCMACLNQMREKAERQEEIIGL